MDTVPAPSQDNTLPNPWWEGAHVRFLTCKTGTTYTGLCGWKGTVRGRPLAHTWHINCRCCYPY